MGRIRTIKPEFFKHEELFDAEIEEGLPLRLAFAGLWTCCDREGRFEWRPRALKTDIMPYDDIDFSRVLDALTSRGFVVMYRLDGREYGHVPGFSRHQVINGRESDSKLPDPRQADVFKDNSSREPRVNHASSTRHVPAHGEREGEREGEEGGGDAGAREADFDEVGNPGTQPDRPTPDAQPENPPGWKRLNREVLLRAMGSDPMSGITGPNGRMIGGLADMRIAGAWVDDLGLTPDEVSEVVAEVMAKKSDGAPSSFKYFDNAMQRFAGQKAAPRLTPIEGGQDERNNQGTANGRTGTAERAHQKLIAGFARAVSDE